MYIELIQLLDSTQIIAPWLDHRSPIHSNAVHEDGNVRTSTAEISLAPYCFYPTKREQLRWFWFVRTESTPWEEDTQLADHEIDTGQKTRVWVDRTPWCSSLLRKHESYLNVGTAMCCSFNSPQAVTVCVLRWREQILQRMQQSTCQGYFTQFEYHDLVKYFPWKMSREYLNSFIATSPVLKRKTIR